jgi:hypothetical protein
MEKYITLPEVLHKYFGEGVAWMWLIKLQAL